MIIRIIFFFLGAVKIKVCGDIASFMNYISKENLMFVNCKEDDETFFFLLKDAEKVLGFASENGIKTEVAEKKGVPIIFMRYGKRVGIYIGILLFSVITLISGRVVWYIDVTGCENVSPEKIVENLEMLGFTYGTDFKKTNFDALTRRYLIEYDDLGWISINMHGTHAHVEVRELKKGSDEKESSSLCNITASENGKIVLVEVESGKACVATGDFVSEGDLLIGCVMTSGETRLRFERAKGKALAEVRRSFSYFVPYEKEVESLSGAQSSEYELIFFKKRIKISENSGNPYKFYDTIDKENYITLPNGFKLPVGVGILTFREVVKEKCPLTVESAEEEAEKLFPYYLKEALDGAELLSFEKHIEHTDSGCTVGADILCLADIGRKTEVEIKE